MFPSLGNRLLELARIPQGAIVLTVQSGYDFEHLDFGDETFDAVLCAHPTLHDLPDVQSTLREWRRVTKAGGAVGFTGYGEHAFQPLAELFDVCIQRCCPGFAISARSASWWPLSDAETCGDLLRDARFENVEVRVEQLGRYLKDADECWDIICDDSFQCSIAKLTPEQEQELKAELLREVNALTASNSSGIWLNMPAIFAIGRKPGTTGTAR